MTAKSFLSSFSFLLSTSFLLASPSYSENQETSIAPEKQSASIGNAANVAAENAAIPSPNVPIVSNSAISENAAIQNVSTTTTIAAGPEIKIKEIVSDPKKSFASFMDINPNFVTEFYAARNYQPLWIAGNQWNEKARMALETLHHSGDEALFPSDYETHLLPKNLEAQPDDDVATMDVRLTSALMQYIIDVSFGRRELRKSNEDRAISGPDPDAHKLLVKGLESSNFKAFLESLPPQHDGYKRLKEVFLKLENKKENQVLPVPFIRNLTLNKQDPDIKFLHNRLIASGDLAEPSNDPTVFDQKMRDALKSFQRKHHIASNGILNSVTLTKLNRRQEDLTKKIALNMERWRWLEQPTPGKSVLVNVPGFMLYAYDNGKFVFDKKVIVGNEHRKTPIFTAPMKSLKFNPNWSIPAKIAAKDILPQIQDDPVNFFSDYGMRVLDSKGAEINPHSINWKSLTSNNFPYHLQQKPGNRNALGKIRFTIENPYDVYLHDTSSREKFEEKNRMLSSGCIRVQHPEVLASFVLSDNQKWDITRVKSAMQGTNTNVVNLPSNVRVDMLYATAFVDPNGELHIYDDVYERDDNVIHLLGMNKKKMTE